jgi:tetratricopeptide (TPR) repeat protein
MLLRQRNFKEAEKKFIEAIELNPDESAYVGINAWAKYLGAPDKEVVFEDVKKELKNAIEMDKNIAENFYYLGSIYKFSENLASAEKFFAMAIEKDPNYIEAKRELRLLKSRKGKNVSSKGSSKKIEKKFWSGLFKK